MQIVIDIPEENYQNLKAKDKFNDMWLNYYEKLIVNGTPVNANTLADMVINERIYGDFKQDICYEVPVIEDVKCRLELSIIDRRPCYCGAGLRETWRDK